MCPIRLVAGDAGCFVPSVVGFRVIAIQPAAGVDLKVRLIWQEGEPEERQQEQESPAAPLPAPGSDQAGVFAPPPIAAT